MEPKVRAGLKVLPRCQLIGLDPVGSCFKAFAFFANMDSRQIRTSAGMEGQQLL
jgi:hypothetical protein